MLIAPALQALKQIVSSQSQLQIENCGLSYEFQSNLILSQLHAHSPCREETTHQDILVVLLNSTALQTMSECNIELIYIIISLAGNKGGNIQQELMEKGFRMRTGGWREQACSLEG